MASDKRGLKYLLYAFFVTIAIFAIAFLIFMFVKHKEKSAIPVFSTVNEPYICFEGLDWGMSQKDCFAVLGANESRFKSYEDKSPYGFDSTAYVGKAEIFSRLSDVTLWFTSYDVSQPPGLSAIIVANVYTKGEMVLPKLEKMFADTNCEKSTTTSDHTADKKPYMLKVVDWKKGEFDDIPDIDFRSSWEEYIQKNSSKKNNALSSEYLSVCRFQYMENAKRFRMDFRGEAAAYYNCLRKKLAE